MDHGPRLFFSIQLSFLLFLAQNYIYIYIVLWSGFYYIESDLQICQSKFSDPLQPLGGDKQTLICKSSFSFQIFLIETLVFL
jgi:hypothetical protein